MAAAPDGGCIRGELGDFDRNDVSMLLAGLPYEELPEQFETRSRCRVDESAKPVSCAHAFPEIISKSIQNSLAKRLTRFFQTVRMTKADQECVEIEIKFSFPSRQKTSIAPPNETATESEVPD